ncbi:TPA: toxin-antitoxin system HicB family antitoxin [Bacillus paranthracis]|uniref:toxin-antitoxin system HicB family antitoxin n=1 Tax=Bacillus cereus group TaxID=86661 RepID=UPI0022E3E8C4|nr:MULTISPECIES: toxin-antitoxin system HicB family antitoxin [Bacillus cereus group]MDA2141824.1 toxin-antitoxin system HicB family antitoxin [Bacillus cereus group sp. Bc256]MDH2890446.1 type II toxin-antitoxin system HicB family antitoxin [Bacillus cytotoxicus]
MNNVPVKFRIPEDLKERLFVEAELFDLSVNQFVILLLSSRYDPSKLEVLETYEKLLSLSG